MGTSRCSRPFDSTSTRSPAGSGRRTASSPKRSGGLAIRRGNRRDVKRDRSDAKLPLLARVDAPSRSSSCWSSSTSSLDGSQRQLTSRESHMMVTNKSGNRRRGNWIAAAMAAAAAMTSPAYAADDTWIGLGADGNWNNASNWDATPPKNAPPVAGDVLQFGGTTNLVTNNNFAAN